MEGEKAKAGVRPKNQILTCAKAEQILGHIERGHTMWNALQLEGYAPGADGAWGKEARSNPDGDSEYTKACRLFTENKWKARAKFKENLLSKWRESDDWRAAATLLQQRFPEEYGSRIQLIWLAVELAVAGKNKDLPRAIKLLKGGKSKTVMKYLMEFGFQGDSQAVSAESLPDSQLATIAEKGLMLGEEADAPAEHNAG